MKRVEEAILDEEFQEDLSGELKPEQKPGRREEVSWAASGDTHSVWREWRVQQDGDKRDNKTTV